MVEATLDTYHFAFIHASTIGDPGNPRAPNVRTQIVDGKLTFSYTIDQPANETIINVAEERDADGLRPVTYTLLATPNVVHLKKDSAAGVFVIYFAYAPVTDLDAELQVHMDRPTVGYRKWTAEMGIRFL